MSLPATVQVSFPNSILVLTAVSLAGDVTGLGSANTVGKINGTSLAGLATGFLYNTTVTGVPSSIPFTGTGNVVLATSPTFAGTLNFAGGATIVDNGSGTITITNTNVTLSGAINLSASGPIAVGGILKFNGSYGIATIGGSLTIGTNVTWATLNGTTGVATLSTEVITAASTTTRAGFNLPSGTAPTSPVNGDMWYDGTNLKVQLAGATKTVTVS